MARSLYRFRRPRVAPRTRRGVSLIEILFVSVLVGVALFPLYDMLTTSERGSASSVNRVRATNYAADLLETLKAVPYDQLPLTEENGEDPLKGWSDAEVADHVLPPADPDGPEPVDLGARITPVTTGGDFSRFLSISQVSSRDDDNTWGGLKRIVVTVEWAEIMSGKRTTSDLKMAYLVSREGISQR